MERTEFGGDRGVVLASHPPLIEPVRLKAPAEAYKAGTILKVSNGVYEAAEDADTPAAVLVSDAGAHAEEGVGLALIHGAVAGARLLNKGQGAAAADLKAKLPAVGIYACQEGWDGSNYR